MNIEVSQQKIDMDGKPVKVEGSKEGHVASKFDLA